MQLNPLLKLGRNTRPRGRLRGRRVADRFHDLQVDERLRRRQRARDGYAVAFYEDPAATLDDLREAVKTLEDTVRVARRVLGEKNDITLRMRWNYARALYLNPAATLDDLHEAETTLEDVERIARRVLGGSHPMTEDIDHDMRNARSKLVDALAEGVRDLSVS